MVCMEKQPSASKIDQMNHKGAQNELNAPLWRGERGAVGGGLEAKVTIPLLIKLTTSISLTFLMNFLTFL